MQAPAVDATGTFLFLQRMSDRYNRVPKSATSQQMRDKLRDQGLDKLLEDSAGGPMNAFNSCKYIGKMNGLDIYVNTTNKNSVDVLFKALNSCKYMKKRMG